MLFQLITLIAWLFGLQPYADLFPRCAAIVHHGATTGRSQASRAALDLTHRRRKARDRERAARRAMQRRLRGPKRGAARRRPRRQAASLRRAALQIVAAHKRRLALSGMAQAVAVAGFARAMATRLAGQAETSRKAVSARLNKRAARARGRRQELAARTRMPRVQATPRGREARLVTPVYQPRKALSRAKYRDDQGYTAGDRLALEIVRACGVATLDQVDLVEGLQDLSWARARVLREARYSRRAAGSDAGYVPAVRRARGDLLTDDGRETLAQRAARRAEARRAYEDRQARRDARAQAQLDAERRRAESLGWIGAGKGPRLTKMERLAFRQLGWVVA